MTLATFPCKWKSTILGLFLAITSAMPQQPPSFSWLDPLAP